MITVVTLSIKKPDQTITKAYLADGSLTPIYFQNGEMAMAWAYLNRSLFEQNKGDRIRRGHFGIMTCATEAEAEEMLARLGAVPCDPLNDELVVNEEGTHLEDESGNIRISLVPDMDAYRARLELPPEERD